MRRISGAAVALAAVLAGGGVALAQSGIDFGNDSSQWANDGECDDPRFEGPGMTDTTLLDSDIRRDATDCRRAWQRGELRLRGAGGGNAVIMFGDDASQWANDGECDDPRFRGPGMTTTTLLQSDIGHDATDCRQAFYQGTLSLAPRNTSISFGNDSSQWANDGECDDPRFIGPGMTETRLLSDDIGADATDCRSAYMAGNLEVRE